MMRQSSGADAVIQLLSTLFARVSLPSVRVRMRAWVRVRARVDNTVVVRVWADNTRCFLE